MMRKLRLSGAVVLATTLGIFAGACSNDATNNGGTATAPVAPGEVVAPGETAAPEPEDTTVIGTNLTGPLEPATITWVHNMTSGLTPGFIQQVAAEFEALHPGIEVNVQAVENDLLRDTTLPEAFHGGAAPDLFQSWGGGELREWANEGIAMDLTEVLAPTIDPLGGSTDIWSIDGHIYGVPYTLGPAGMWVNLNVLNEAGLVQNAVLDASGNVESGTVNWPTTMDGLFEMWDTLQEHGITPVAVGGASPGWAAAWWWYATASKVCSASALASASNEHNWSDPCWIEAGQQLQTVLNQNAFNDGWLDTPPQGGTNSSAGMVATGQAAMEFMGPWNRQVMGEILNQRDGSPAGTPPPAYLVWYPLPDIADGAGAGTLMAGGDGFSVLNPARGSQARSDAAAALLAYFMSDEVQVRFADPYTSGIPGVPVSPAAIVAEDDPVIGKMAEALRAAPHTVQWLDVLFGDEVGGTMNNVIVEFMDGQGAPQGIVDAINDAAGN